MNKAKEKGPKPRCAWGFGPFRGRYSFYAKNLIRKSAKNNPTIIVLALSKLKYI